MDARAETDTTLLHAALAYAERDWAVFPCKGRSKRPATAHSVNDAVTNGGQIRRWWAAMPDAMLEADENLIKDAHSARCAKASRWSSRAPRAGERTRSE